MIRNIGMQSPAFGRMVKLDGRTAVNTDHVIKLEPAYGPSTRIFLTPTSEVHKDGSKIEVGGDIDTVINILNTEA